MASADTMKKKKHNIKRLKKLFPVHIRHHVLFDAQGLYSTTEHDVAQAMTRILQHSLENHVGEKASKSAMVDCTAGIGGNSLSFAKAFRHIYSFEIDYRRWVYLRRNMTDLNPHHNITCIHGNVVTYIMQRMVQSMRLFFFDPPWGGTLYKRKNEVRLYLSGMPLHDIVNHLPAERPAVCAVEVPYNFGVQHFVRNLASHIRLHTIHRFRQVWLIVCHLFPRPSREQ